ncbi:MAG: ABC transporter ATP-binding protein [Eubacteriales bacterium]
MITIKSLKKYARERLILNIPELTVTKGERLILVGPNGSGKTTLLRIMAGTLKADEGEVAFSDSNSPAYYLPQQSYGFSMSVYKNLITALHEGMHKNEKRKAVEKTLKEFDLEALAKKHGNKLSGGETQRMALARLLITPKSLLILDEPCSAADISGIDLIEKVLLDFCNKNESTLVMATHSPRQALNIATRVILLQDGEIAESGTPDELLNHPQTEWGKRFIEHWKV